MNHIKVNSADKLLESLESGKCLYRKSWLSSEFEFKYIFKQIPAEIGRDIIPNMQSVPEDAKKIILSDNKIKSIKYIDQIVIVTTRSTGNDSDCDKITYYQFNTTDLLADDWYILEP
jgi:hypothetical protein